MKEKSADRDNNSGLLKSDEAQENSHGHSESEANGSGPEISQNPEVLKRMPPEVRKVIEFGMEVHRATPTPHPLTDKINEEHIDRILVLSDQSEARSFKSSSQLRWFTLAYVVIAVFLFAFLTIFLVRADTDLYREVVKLLAVFLGGFGGGFGVKSYMERRGGT